MVVAVAAALVIAVALVPHPALAGPAHPRMVNYGLVAASLLLAVGAVWLAAAFLVARSDLQRSVAHGSAPTETLAQAGIAVQQARGDEILNLISRSGDTSFVQNFQAVRRELGPGPGTLLSTAAAASQGGPGPPGGAAAVRDASPWYTANEQVYRLDVAANYAAETRLVIGTGPGSSAAGFQRLERDLSRAVAADQVTFRSAATAGAGAFGGLEAGIIVAVAADGGGLRLGHQPAPRGVPVSGATVREQAESAVSAAAAQRDTIQANLLELDASFGKRLLAGAQIWTVRPGGAGTPRRPR